MRNRVLLGLTLLACLGLTVLWAALLVTPRQNITPSGFERIWEGMSQEQVEAILGCPPGNYSGEDLPFLEAVEGLVVYTEWGDPEMAQQFVCKPNLSLWVGDRFAVGVKFTPDGKVQWKGGCQVTGPSLLRRLRHRLGL